MNSAMTMMKRDGTGIQCLAKRFNTSRGKTQALYILAVQAISYTVIDLANF